MQKSLWLTAFAIAPLPLGCGGATASVSDGSAAQPVPSAMGQQASGSATRASAPDAGRAQADRAGEVPVPAAPAGADLPQVDPIVPDGEFNQAIPSIDVANDPELDKPLESIDAFERRVSTPTPIVGAAPAGSAPRDTTSAAPAASAPAGPQPVSLADDADLAKPLPPLDTFQVEPVQLARPQPEEASHAVRYGVRVTGLDAADEEAEVNLSSQFRRLSALKGGGKAENTAQVAARLTEDSKLMQQLLASEGWYSPTVTTRLDQGDAANNQALIAVIAVAPGKRYSLSSITINAGATIPPDLVASNFALKVGEPIIADRVQGAEAQIAVALPENGYPFAKVGQRDILLDQDKGTGDYTLPVDVGNRGRFGDFVTVPGKVVAAPPPPLDQAVVELARSDPGSDKAARAKRKAARKLVRQRRAEVKRARQAAKLAGKLAFDAHHVAVLARYKRDELYDSRKVDDLRQALVATGLFSTIGVVPEHSGQFAPDGSEYVTTQVTQNAGPPRTIAATIGYGSGEGITAQGTWTHRNLFPPEGALIAGVIAGTKQQGASVTFRRSNAGKRDHTVELDASILRSTYDAYNANTARLAARISRDSTPIWQKKYTWAAGAQLLASREQTYDFTVGRRDYKSYFIGGLSGQVGLDFSDSLLNPTKGFRLTTLIEPEGSIKGGFTPYVRARIDGSAYYPFGGFVLAGRVRFGTIQGASLDDLAPSRRFYAGGGGSVRGYSYQKLGALDPNGDPIGGRSLTEGSAEVRYRFGNYGVVGFIDAGQAYASTAPKFTNLRYGVGLGGRFYTNFGPLRLDVATPIARRKGEGLINVYVSIGQAF